MPTIDTARPQPAAPPAAPAQESAARPPVPAREFMRTYSRDLFTLPDLYSVGYGSRKPNEIRLNFGNESARQLADALLRDEVNGVRLVLSSRHDDTAGEPGPIPATQDWWPNVAKAGAALPGVLDHDRLGGSALVYWTDSRERSAHLGALVNEQVGPATVFYRHDRRPDRFPLT